MTTAAWPAHSFKNLFVDKKNIHENRIRGGMCSGSLVAEEIG